MRRIFLLAAIFLANLLIGLNSVYSQCAMCKENMVNSDEGMKLASGLNDGIVYLLVVPYLIFAGFATAIYISYISKKRRKIKNLHLN